MPRKPLTETAREIMENRTIAEKFFGGLRAASWAVVLMSPLALVLWIWENTSSISFSLAIAAIVGIVYSLVKDQLFAVNWFLMKLSLCQSSYARTRGITAYDFMLFEDGTDRL